VTELPVIDPSAACRPAVAGQLRVDLEGSRGWITNCGGFYMGADPEEADPVASRLAALDDDALLEDFRWFIDHNGVLMWLLSAAHEERLRKAAAPPAEDPAVRAMAAESSAPPVVPASTPGAPGAMITIRPGG